MFNSEKVSNRALINTAVIILLAVIGIFLRAWCLTLPLDRDVGLYAVISRGLSHHLLPYRDIFDHKPPGIYFLFWLVGKTAGLSVFSINLLALTGYILNAVLICLLINELFGFKPALTAGLLYSFFSVNPYIEGLNSAQVEVFLISFVVFAYFLLFKYLRRKKLCLLIFSGVSMGIGLLFKQIAVLDVFLAVFLLIYFSQGIKRIAVFILSALIPWVFTFLFFIAAKTFREFFYYVFTFNLKYIGRGASSAGSFFHSFLTVNLKMASTMPLIILLSILFVLACLVKHKGIKAVEKGKNHLFLVLWLLLTLGEVSLSGRFFPYYYIILIPPLSAASAVFLFPPFINWKGFSVYAKALIIAVLILLFSVSLYRFSGFVSGNPLNTIKKVWPDEPFAETYQLGRYLKKTADSEDYLFVWGDEAELYFYSGLTSSSYYRDAPFIYFFKIMRRNPYFVLFSDFHRRPPEYVVIDSRHIPAFRYLPQIGAYFSDNYLVKKRIPVIRDKTIKFNLTLLKRKK